MAITRAANIEKESRTYARDGRNMLLSFPESQGFRSKSALERISTQVESGVRVLIKGQSLTRGSMLPQLTQAQ